MLCVCCVWKGRDGWWWERICLSSLLLLGGTLAGSLGLGTEGGTHLVTLAESTGVCSEL